MVPGLILAAGRSIRMGRPKALLPSDRPDEPFVVRLGRSVIAGGAVPLHVVGRPDDTELQEVVARDLPQARFVPNPDAERGGQLSSLNAGIAASAGETVSGVLVAPVDVPMISRDTVATLLSAFAAAPHHIVRAVYRGRHGHPVIFPRERFDDLRRADPSLGAKAVLRACAARILDVEVPDPAVAHDVDTPDDYDRFRRSNR